MALPDPTITASLQTEEQCVVYLEALRWPAGVACPNCGNQKVSRFQARGKSGKSRQICQCLDRDCKHQFSATTGTIFHDSHLPLAKWFEALRLLADPATATPVNQLRFVLGVQYKTAKNVAERIQRALESGSIEMAAATVPAKVAANSRVATPAAEQPKRPRAVPAANLAATPVKAREPKPKVRVPSPPIPIQPAAQANQRLAAASAKPSAPPTVVDSMLSVFTTAMNLGVKPPLAAVNFLKKKIMD